MNCESNAEPLPSHLKYVQQRHVAKYKTLTFSIISTTIFTPVLRIYKSASIVAIRQQYTKFILRVDIDYLQQAIESAYATPYNYSMKKC